MSPGEDREYVVGVISDTHGRLPPEVPRLFAGVDLIVHAGDVGGAGILQWLEKIAPVVAVRGNMDALDLEDLETAEVGGIRICVLHDIHRLKIDPKAADMRAVISGHSHRPSLREEDGVLYLDPGSATRPRGGHTATVAILRIRDGEPRAAFAHLE